MSELKLFTVSQQVAEHLRAQINQGKWKGTMPGKHFLAAELGITHQLVEAALKQLEREHLLVAQGSRRRRLITPTASSGEVKGLRIGLMLWDKEDRYDNLIIDLQHTLSEAGHSYIIPRKTLMDLKMEVTRIAQHLKGTEVDAWVVSAGSQEVLQWFAKQKLPVFAFFGGSRALPIAGTGAAYETALITATRNLIELGHRAIVLIVRRHHRLPQPEPPIIAFLATLKAHGIQTSSYHLPDWEESAEGFQACLEALFKVTPPTALFVDESQLFIAARHFLANQGLRVPQDVSLIALETDPVHDWCFPTIAQIRVEFKSVIHHIMSWVGHVRQGKKDVRQHIFLAKYVAGGTVGPAPSHRIAINPKA